MKNKGILVANEIDFKRLGPLKINLERTGLTNIVISNIDGRLIKGENKYDRILLDHHVQAQELSENPPKQSKPIIQKN